MFSCLKSCKYINLYNFKIPDEAEIDYLFDCVSKNTLICINDNETKEKVKVKSLWNDFSSCDNICFKKNSKIELKQKTCVLHCSKSEYQYE